jgi:hypothetical protein
LVNFENPAFVVLYVIGLWLGVNFVISVVSGWAELARVYRFRGKFLGESWSFQSGQMRLLMGIGNALRVGADQQGLYLSLLFVFRPDKPPLYVPWHDIATREGRFLFWNYIEFRFRQAPNAYLKISKDLGQKVAVASGGSWPGDRAAVVSPS